MNMKRYIAFILLILVSIIIFSNTFQNPFMWDDNELIVENRYIKHLKFIPFLFSFTYWKYHHPLTKGFYRPITTTSFALDYSLWGTNPFGYHLTNLLLHILNVILIYFLINRLGGRGLAFLAALFFAAHPIHTESVSWIKNRSDLLVLLFFLISFMLFIRYTQKRKGVLPYLVAIFCFILALSSKAVAFSLPFILVSYILCFIPRESYKKAIISTIPFFGVMAGYIIYKLIAPSYAAATNVEYSMAISSKIFLVTKTLGYYFKLLILPINLNAERLLAIPESFFEPGVFISFIVLLIISIITIKTFTREKLISFGLLWIFLTLGPVSNIIFLSARPIAEQRLYIPSLGFCLILALVITKLWQSKPTKPIAILSSAFILIFYSSATIMRNYDWNDPVAFWSKTLEASPDSSRAHNNLGKEYSDIGKHEDAIASYKKAIEINPDYVMAYSNLGKAYDAIDKKETAITFCKKAIEINPDYAMAYYKLGK